MIIGRYWLAGALIIRAGLGPTGAGLGPGTLGSGPALAIRAGLGPTRAVLGFPGAAAPATGTGLTSRTYY